MSPSNEAPPPFCHKRAEGWLAFHYGQNAAADRVAEVAADMIASATPDELASGALEARVRALAATHRDPAWRGRILACAATTIPQKGHGQ